MRGIWPLITTVLFLYIVSCEAFQLLTPRWNSICRVSTNAAHRGALRMQASGAKEETTAVVDENLGNERKNLNLIADNTPVTYEEDGTKYVMCSQCKSSYVYDENEFGSARGRKVCCGVCGKEWFQSGARVLTTDNLNYLTGMTEKKVSDIRRAVDLKNWPRFPRVDKIGVFVGNLPYNYDEDEIGQIFAEYGITNISLIRDPSGLSKGFAFVEVAHQEDADRMIEEMHHFYTDEDRKLTVRLATQNGKGRDQGTKDKEQKVWKKRD